MDLDEIDATDAVQILTDERAMGPDLPDHVDRAIEVLLEDRVKILKQRDMLANGAGIDLAELEAMDL